ncbi:MAG: YjbH domain-containing protein [Chlamydiia bacterium]
MGSSPLRGAMIKSFSMLFGLFAGMTSGRADEAPSHPDVLMDLSGCGVMADLEVVARINRMLDDRLPMTYNAFLQGGVFQTPSARVAEDGEVAIGATSLPPYSVYNLALQYFSRLELTFNYRVFRDLPDPVFGHCGFGDLSDRIANIKFQILHEEDSDFWLPAVSIGVNDALGTDRFRSFYIVATQAMRRLDLEATLGWGTDRLHGFFGSFVWSPLRSCRWGWVRGISLGVEWDPQDYRNDPHPCGRSVSSRINYGLIYRVGDFLQLSVNRLRGEEISASLVLHTNLGHADGLVPKYFDQPAYQGPVNLHPIDNLRTAHDLSADLAFAFREQGLVLQGAWLTTTDNGKRELRIRVINQVYRWETEVRSRLQQILGALVPDTIDVVTAVVTAYGVDSHQYQFRVCDLRRFVMGTLHPYELGILSPMKEVTPVREPATQIFKKPLHAYIWDVHPAMQSIVGSTDAKFKGLLGVAIGPQGYLWNNYFYRITFQATAWNGFQDCGDYDVLNPSQVPHVRTDSVNYQKWSRLRLNQAFLQRTWSLQQGWYLRASGGYFEPAYAGVALEALWYPVGSDVAVGLELAPLLKRSYNGFGFSQQVRQWDGCCFEWKKFYPYQAFLDLYYHCKPICTIGRVTVGQFLARDIGARFELNRYWASGLRVFLWYTWSNSGDHINGKPYHDQGVGLSIPIDLFLPRSSRGRFSYAVAAWKRDCGARCETGTPLYWNILEERLQTPGYAD